MFERFAREARTTVEAAGDEARTAGARTIDAEHLLLALSRDPEVQALGLDHEALREALDAEEARSLAAVGINRDDFDAPATPRQGGGARLGASAKVAIERALKTTVIRGQRQITVSNLLLGVLAAEYGRVPRALQLAGIEVSQLRAQL